MRRVWMIRAGDEGEQIDALRRADLIGLRGEGIGDLREVTPDQIEEQLIESGVTVGVAAQRSMLTSFASDVRPGDLVVSPYTARREVWVGIVRGEYQYSDEPRVPRFRHVRAVEWLGWLDRDVAWMRDQWKSIDRPATVVELPSREWWWRQVDSREFGQHPRPVRSTPAPAKRTRAKAASGSGSGSAASTSTRKPPVAMVRCAGSCGYQWAPSSLVDGLCADCRND